MGHHVSVTKLKEQIEAAKRGLAEMSPMITVTDSAFQPVAMSAAKFTDLDGGHENDALDSPNQNMVANDDMATDDGFQFFHRPNRSDRPFAPSSSLSMENAGISATSDDQPPFKALDQRLDRLEVDISQNQKHILELITLLSGLNMVEKPTRQNSASFKYLLRRYLYLFVIGFLVVGWVALTPSGHLWINHFLGLV